MPKVLDGSCAVALGELLAVGTVEQRQVRVDRRIRAEGAQDQDLAGRVREVVRSAHDVRDPHVAVVYGDREVVEGAAVRAGDHEVVDRGVLEGHLAADHVLDHRRPLVRNA